MLDPDLHFDLIDATTLRTALRAMTVDLSLPGEIEQTRQIAHRLCSVFAFVRNHLTREPTDADLADRLLFVAWEFRNLKPKLHRLREAGKQAFNMRGRYGQLVKGYRYGAIMGLLEWWRDTDYALEVSGIKRVWDSIAATVPPEWEQSGPEARMPSVRLSPETLARLKLGLARQLLGDMLADFDAEDYYAQLDWELDQTGEALQSGAAAQRGMASGSRYEFVPTAEDITVLSVLAQYSSSRVFADIVQEAARMVREAKRAGHDTTLVLLSETKLAERIPLLMANDLVARPVRPDGTPYLRKGVGITVNGRKLLESPAP